MKGFAVVVIALSLLFAFSPMSGGIVQESASVSQHDEVACGLLRGIGRGLRGIGRGIGRVLGAHC